MQIQGLHYTGHMKSEDSLTDGRAECNYKIGAESQAAEVSKSRSLMRGLALSPLRRKIRGTVCLVGAGRKYS